MLKKFTKPDGPEARTHAMALDFTHRALADEGMDSLASYSEYRKCLHDLDSVSRLVLAHRPTLRFLDQVAARNPAQPIHILDVACGDGTMLRRIANWAAGRKLDVRLTGLDLNPWAIEVAREFPNSNPPIEYIRYDVFGYEPSPAVDIILSAHFAHHLPDHDIIRFLGWMERNARLGWFINDLHRHPNPYRMFQLLGFVAPWNPVVIEDGLISIRRAFTVENWEGCIAATDIPHVIIEEQFPARVTVSRLKA